ncbi:MAG: DUF2771 domain-containing protein [Mycobacteriaceae bacterium]|nr:DUF2771 domain-containing protein [Mycobacteriaceae bacterium]
MRRDTIFRTVLVTVLAVLAAVGAGTATWLLGQDNSPQQPEITAYTHGHVVRVGPFLYCNVLNLDNCQTPQSQGELPVNAHDRIQLSVPDAIGHAPWRLLQVYADPADTTTTFFRPDSRLAVTIPTVDPQRGRLTGIAVQLLTLVVDPAGELREAPHAEWSVRTIWSSPTPAR